MATAVESLKRITWARDKQTQDRVFIYMYIHAEAVLNAGTPNANDLALAKMIYARQVNMEDMTLVMTTQTTISDKIDADEEVTEYNLSYAVTDSDKFHSLAESYAAAGLLT